MANNKLMGKPVKPPFDKRKAWWWLSKAQKQQLQALREAREFGGESGVGAGAAPYFWAQSGEDLNAADEANITPTGFTFEAESVFNATWPSVIDRIITKAMG